MARRVEWRCPRCKRPFGFPAEECPDLCPDCEAEFSCDSGNSPTNPEVLDREPIFIVTQGEQPVEKIFRSRSHRKSSRVLSVLIATLFGSVAAIALFHWLPQFSVQIRVAEPDGHPASSNGNIESGARPEIAIAVNATAQTSSTSFRELSLEDLIVAVEKAVVRVDVATDRHTIVGSGFLVDNEGIIVTNYHVIEGAKSATATFRDGKTLKIAGVLAIVPEKDIAILKVSNLSAGLQHLVLADRLPRKGEKVVTFGAPRGLSFSVSEGIVSGIRSETEIRALDSSKCGTWIQTTAPISPGNSGARL